jgi:hypothetical protein
METPLAELSAPPAGYALTGSIGNGFRVEQGEEQSKAHEDQERGQNEQEAAGKERQRTRNRSHIHSTDPRHLRPLANAMLDGFFRRLDAEQHAAKGFGSQSKQ